MPDAMARSAVYALDPDAGRPRAHRYAIVAGPYDVPIQRDMVGHLDVDSIGVGAVSRRCNLRVPDRYAAAPKDQYVKQLAVQRCYPADEHICRPTDCYRLHMHRAPTLLAHNSLAFVLKH